MKNKYNRYRIFSMDWINEHFRYDETTGLLYNRVDNQKGEEKDTVVGMIDKRGYAMMQIDYRQYHQQIIVWMITHNGHLPEHQLSHRNGIRSDNRLSNLVDTKHTIQYAIHGRSKYRGVSWDTEKNGWKAQIRVDGKLKHIGSFKDEIEAAHAFDKVARGFRWDEHLLNFSV